ncbi:MAG: peptide ABC transporter substrate-binding protein, partial [Leptolyngbya sp. SIO1D8]|nr:peptide ABC transporter substrate-binding protein [Leptolyngbya sp. SIO1D8]
MLLVLGVVIASGCSQSPPTDADVSETTEAEDPIPNEAVLRLLYSRVAVTLNPHLATGVQDFEAGRIVLEPLATADETGQLIPILAAEIPSPENGGVSPDGKSVTWKLLSDIQWSDETPFTAEDVVFTFDFIKNPQVGAATAQYYDAVESVEAIDEHTVKVTFKEVMAAWQIPFTGQNDACLPRE